MIKFSANSDYDFGVASVAIVTDEKSLTKRASCLPLLKYAKDPKQTDLHIIALGAYEGTGINRNQDLFLEKDCREKHATFVKANRAVHRHHKNKPNDPKFGNIKASAYNENMKRIELVVGLDNQKCADILDEQEKKGHTNWSMACKIAHDVCTICSHKAKDDASRCEHTSTKLGELMQDGKIAAMINPEPNWFEISHVARPADRVGMSLSKLASADNLKPLPPSHFMSLYGDIYVPTDLDDCISKKASDKRELLNKLSEIEKHIEAVSVSPQSKHDKYLNDHASKLNMSEKISAEQIDELRKYASDKVFRGLADKGIILGPDDFSSYVFGDRIKSASRDGMKTHLTDAFHNLEEHGGQEKFINNEKYDPSCSDLMPFDLKKMISGLVGSHSLEGAPAHARVVRITVMKSSPIVSLKSSPKKEERSKEAFDKALADQYLAYKVAALNYINEQGKLTDEILTNAVIQNRQ